MIEQMSDSYKREVEEFKKWPDNGSARINDSKSGFSPLPRYERPYEPSMSPALKSILDGTFNIGRSPQLILDEPGDSRNQWNRHPSNSK